MPIAFVTFHVDVPATTARAIRAVNGSFDPVGPASMIELMFRSVRRCHPDARTVLLTDESTALPTLDGAEVIRDRAVDPASPMLSRTEAYARLCETLEADALLLDADMLLAKPIDDLFASDDFDVALTIRDHEMPVNGGAAYVSRVGARNASRFFDEAARRMRAGSPDELRWWGDQRALSELVAPLGASDRGTIDGVRVRLLPCDEWNFSTVDNHAMPGPYPDARLLHFKGNRKRDMRGYAERWLGLPIPSPACGGGRVNSPSRSPDSAARTR